MSMELKKQKRHHDSEEDIYTFEAILDDSLVESIPLVEVYVSRIKDRKKTSEIIVGLNRIHPVESLQHLKRVNKDRVLMCLNEGLSENEVRDIFINLNFDLCAVDDFMVLKVASKAPKTRKQFEECNKLWPCNFHKSDYLEKLVSGDCFTDDEQINNNKWMRLAMESGNRGDGCGAVVAFGNECVAVASDSSFTHPLHHAPMVAIDLVARSQGGGIWPVSPLDFFTMTPPPPDPTGPYLCTGYDVYLSLEPCVMCSMALIHSRARRIFYCNSNPTRGALFSLTKIHSLKALNHHYEVFRVKKSSS